MSFYVCLQGDNGRFQLSVVRNGQAFPVFDVVPESVLNEATLLIRVKDTSALDYERVKMIEFQVSKKSYSSYTLETIPSKGI